MSVPEGGLCAILWPATSNAIQATCGVFMGFTFIRNHTRTVVNNSITVKDFSVHTCSNARVRYGRFLS